MDKQKRWQFWVIVAVLTLTLYNILPTVFYYMQPLKEPIGPARAEQVAVSMVDRVNQLEKDSTSWIASYTKLLNIKPKSIDLKENQPGVITVSFFNTQDAGLFRRMLPAAGARIPFMPAQLGLYDQQDMMDQNSVDVARQIDVHLSAEDVKTLFHFSSKYEEDGTIAPLYESIVLDRASQLAYGFAGPSRVATQVALIALDPNNRELDDTVLSISRSIVDMEQTFGSGNAIAERYFASFSQMDNSERASNVQKFNSAVSALKTRLEAELATLDVDAQETADRQRRYLLNHQVETLGQTGAILTKQMSTFKEGKLPLSLDQIQKNLEQGLQGIDPRDPVQKLSLEGRSPFVDALVIDWGHDTIELQFYPDIQKLREEVPTTDRGTFIQSKLNQMIINDIATISRVTDEEINPSRDSFQVPLSTLTNMQSFLTFDLGTLASIKVDHLVDQIRTTWHPESTDLLEENYPVMNYDTYQTLTPDEQQLGLVLYAPAKYKESPPEGFHPDSIYVVAKGMNAIVARHKEGSTETGQEEMSNDLSHLITLLQKNGFVPYPGNSYGIDPQFKNDFIFRLEGYYGPLLKATREDFIVKGSKRQGVLNFTDVEQRIITRNKIDDRIQEDLLKWQEAYDGAQVSLDPNQKYLIPEPTKSPFWENAKLTASKYVRGDDRKILKWGLDLSGGKTVRIGLRDHENRLVTNPDDLNQAVNELYNRVNKMGVAERTIRIENENIILDFPGSQALSASELVKASAMYFHIVNEKFSPNHADLASSVNAFLQDVWNEAVVTNRKDAQSVNEIAWEHLGGDLAESDATGARSEHARMLAENGLKIANPNDYQRSNAFNDTYSSVTILRGDDPKEWGNQTHPLLITFANYALEGANLTNIQPGYDPMKGNLLAFTVKGSYEGKRTGNPRDDLYAWSSQFSEDRIQGTPKESYSQGHGWRMAIVLNDQVISMPSLNFPIRDQASIEGRFSQREVNQLAADLKAGSLSFTPKILSEHNVSPELGLEERNKGIFASLIAIVLVFVAMGGYYRFAGLIASFAVLLNIFLMWGVLQNLGAAITLPGIAGIVLTIGMAVDANVLVFERIREEFKISGRIASAIQTGYRKAFSAIIDSNITTIIAALILLQFDSGPIKGFAVTLIIGIVSSMFTALFMTRYFFAGWVRKPKNKHLTMAEFVGNTQFNFLKYSRIAIITSLSMILMGGALFFNESKTLFGMDFTGGYSLTVEFDEQPGTESYRMQAYDALLAQGATTNDIQVQELSKPNQLRIQLGIGMEEPGHPFYQLPETLPNGKFTYDFESVPRITWLVKALEEGGLTIQESDLENLDNAWTAMSGQFSDAMRNNAMMALGFALLSILIYITLRFEFKYAVGAVIALAHDVAITMGILAFFHWMGVPVQINLEVIGAIMTIIGYSLNDTIIVFDRIREDLKLLRKLKYNEIINHALNVTLSRTLMTSGTTLLVLLALVFLGGSTIFDFALVMTVGVVVGTFSSLFIAGPVLLFFHNQEVTHQEKKRREVYGVR